MERLAMVEERACCCCAAARRACCCTATDAMGPTRHAKSIDALTEKTEAKSIEPLSWSATKQRGSRLQNIICRSLPQPPPAHQQYSMKLGCWAVRMVGAVEEQKKYTTFTHPAGGHENVAPTTEL